MLDRYQLYASLAQSAALLAWPAAFAFAVWLFRRELGRLLPRLRLKYKDVDISFRLDEAEKEAKALPETAPAPESEPTPEEKTKFERLAEIDPRAAIADLRRELEDMLQRAALRNQLPFSPKRVSLLFLTRALRNHGIIGEQTSALLDDLRSIGNAAVHPSDAAEFTKTDALRYKALVDEVGRHLQFSELSVSADRPPR